MVLVRHAQSIWNALGRWQGHADPPLSPAGEAAALAAAGEAAALAAAVAAGDATEGGGFDLVVTSDLQRARRTAELLVSAQPDPPPAVVEPLLREFDVGAWSGLTRGEIEARWPDQIALVDAGRLAAPPGGESRADFEARVRAAAGAVAAAVAAHGAGRTLVVSHGGLVRALGRLQGLGDRHVYQLCGYRGRAESGSVMLSHPVDLVGGAGPAPGMTGPGGGVTAPAGGPQAL